MIIEIKKTLCQDDGTVTYCKLLDKLTPKLGISYSIS
jgi:hypothetical protein